MKKALSLFLALVMCMSLCACGGTSVAKGTELTLDNYDNYLQIQPHVGGGEKYEADELVGLGFMGSTGYEATQKDFYTTLAGGCTIKALSSNYNYQDIKVTVRFTGDIVIYDMNCKSETKQVLPFTFTGIFNTDIAGNDKGEITFFDIPENKMAFVQHWSYDVSGLNYSFEIIEVSGTVSPA